MRQKEHALLAVIALLGALSAGNVWSKQQDAVQETPKLEPLSYDDGKFFVISNPELCCSESRPWEGNTAKPESMGMLNNEKRIGRSVAIDMQAGAVVEVIVSAQARGNFLYKIENKVKPSTGDTAAINPVYPAMSSRVMKTEWEPATFFGTGFWCSLMTSAVFKAPEAGKYTFGLLLLKASPYTGADAGHFALHDITMTIRVLEGEVSPLAALDEEETNLPEVQ